MKLKLDHILAPAAFVVMAGALDFGLFIFLTVLGVLLVGAFLLIMMVIAVHRVSDWLARR